MMEDTVIPAKVGIHKNDGFILKLVLDYCRSIS